MLRILIKLFIKDSENVSDPKVRGAYGRLCGIYGIFLNLLLFAGKYAAGIISGSLAITADAFNNLSDAGSSLISLLGFVLAGKKPDSDHPYGHGRMEYLAGLLLSCLILLMGAELLRSSIGKISAPQAINAGLLPALILIAAIAVKFYMAYYNRKVGKKINSAAIMATATDSLSDCISTALVLAAMGIQRFFGLNIDGWAGLIVAACIIAAGVRSLKETLDPLLGKAPDKELVKELEELVMSREEVLGIHDLMVHDYGPGRLMISLHAEVDGGRNIFEVHDAIDRAEMEIRERFGAVATIHMDPIESKDSETVLVRSQLTERLMEAEPVVSIHDFRMVPGPTHTNLIFDAAVPADYPVSDKELKQRIKNIVHETWPERYAVVTIDRIYV